MKRRIVYLLCLSLLLLASCNKIEILEDVSYLDVLQLARKENKSIFLMIGGGENCLPCIDQKKQIRKSKLLRKYKDQFIFYICNVNEKENEFLYFTLLPRVVPNYYIVGTKGNIITFSYAPIDDERIDYELSLYLKGQPQIHDNHFDFRDLPTDTLLHLQNLLIKGNIYLKNADFIKGLDCVRRSVKIHPFLYNTYLEYKIVSRLGNRRAADSLARIAYEYAWLPGRMNGIYAPLIEELKAICKQDERAMPCLKLETSEIDIGNVKQKEVRRIEVCIKNEGDAPLIILDVSRQCSCVKPSWNRQEKIVQGGTGRMYVDFMLDKLGPIKQRLIIYSNAVNNKQEVTIKGDIIKN